MMDNICPICGQYGHEFQERRSWTETDKYHGVKKFGLKQGAGFIAGQVADAIIPGLGTFASIGAKAITGDYYDENHPKSKTHYYTYHYCNCKTCNLSWDKDSDGMKMIDDYYASQMKNDETPGQLWASSLLPFGFLIIAIGLNIIVVLICFLFGFMLSLDLFVPYSWDPGDYFTSSWWPTLKWIADFACFSWKFYAIFLPVFFLIFVLPPLIHNSRIEDIKNAKKQVLANRLGIAIS